MDNDKVMKDNAKRRTLDFLLAKAAEEAQEVSLAYIHMQTKGVQHLTEMMQEIGHLRVALNILEYHLSIADRTDMITLMRDAEYSKIQEIGFRMEADVHTEKAIELFGGTYDSITPDMRRIARFITHGK